MEKLKLDTEVPQSNAPEKNNTRLKFSLDLRLVIVLLLAVIAGMLLIWKPWSSASANDQTVQVTGEAKLTAEPDEFIFYPSYQFKNADKAAALAELTKKSDEVVAKLKELGVPDSKIKTNSSGYDSPVYYNEGNVKDATYTLQLTITLDNLEEAQKVQDYLLTTAPSGTVSPQANFSDTKRKELENQARDEASKDARTKADQMAKNLGFKLGKVKSIADGSGFGGVIPLGLERGAATDAVAPQPALTVQPGENDLHYSVTVIYFIR